MNRDRAPVRGYERGGEIGSGEGRMDEGAAICQVEDGLTSAPKKLLNATEGVPTNR